MWPTEHSLLLLLIGLLPLAYVVYVVFRRGLAELMSLGCLGVLFMWCGYHLSPWLYFWSGEWTSTILIEAFIDDGLFFSTFCMLTFVAGYEYSMKKHRNVRVADMEMIHLLPAVRIKWLLALVLLTAVMFVIRAEGFSEAWQSSVARGVRNWREIDTLGDRLCQINAVLYPVAALCLSLTVAIYILQSRPCDIFKRYALGLSCLVVAMLEGVWSFSRDAGSPLLIFAFVALKLQGHRAIPLALACIISILWLGGIGRNYRQTYYPGLGNFLSATVYGTPEEISDGSDPIVTANINPLSAIDAWTLKASLVETDRAEGWNDAMLLTWNLHPFPSLIVPTAQIGQDLTEVMGTVGFSGVTTPALAELYYAFGWYGFLLMFPVGMVYAWFDGMLRREPSVIAFICLVLCFASFPVGLHNGVRAMSRLPIYALLLYLGHRKWNESTRTDRTIENTCPTPYTSTLEASVACGSPSTLRGER